MATQISQALGVKHAHLEAQGVLDAFTDIDSHFHIHPALLTSPATVELAQSEARVKDHFCKVILLLDGSQKDDPLYRQAVRNLTFPEIPLAGLGYARDDTRGRAIGLKLAAQIANTAHTIVKAGVKEPEIFELVGLFEEDVGSDLISDMCLFLILPDILAFNDRVVKKLQLNTNLVRVGNLSHPLPFLPETQQPLLLIPKEILSPLPVATCWDDIDTVCSYNDAVRDHINKTIGRTWGHAARRIHKSQIKDAILHNPSLLKDLIEQYKRKPQAKYDYQNDPLGEIVWFEASQAYAKSSPLSIQNVDMGDHAQVVNAVTLICQQFKRLVEQNGLFKLLYDQSGHLKPERAAQLLFYGIADAYCAANNVDLSREPDAGRGPVDFKASKGYRSRVNVEVKYSSNKHLVHGYEEQLPIYDKAEQSFHSIYLIIQTNNYPAALRRLQKLRSEALDARRRAPQIILVDGRYRESASRSQRASTPQIE